MSFPRIPSPIYLPSHPVIPLHSLPSAPLTPVPSHPLPFHPLPYPVPYPTISLRTLPSLPYYTLFSTIPRIPSPTYLPSHPYPTLAFPTLRSPRTPSPRIPSPAPYPTLPYHILPDRSRGRNVSFPTSLGYLNPSLLYPPLPSQHPHTLHYPSTSYISSPLPSHPIHSTHPRCPNTLSYCTLPSPTLSSHLLSSPTSP